MPDTEENLLEETGSDDGLLDELENEYEEEDMDVESYDDVDLL